MLEAGDVGEDAEEWLGPMRPYADMPPSSKCSEAAPEPKRSAKCYCKNCKESC